VEGAGGVSEPYYQDDFAGSGSTLRAAKDCGMRAIGIEAEEKWCRVAAERCGQDVLLAEGAA
jgi:site-specific DNA-methyltransferase (adenine-specific)